MDFSQLSLVPPLTRRCYKLSVRRILCKEWKCRRNDVRPTIQSCSQECVECVEETILSDLIGKVELLLRSAQKQPRKHLTEGEIAKRRRKMRIPVLVTLKVRKNKSRLRTEAELYNILQLHDTHIYKCKKSSCNDNLASLFGILEKSNVQIKCWK